MKYTWNGDRLVDSTGGIVARVSPAPEGHPGYGHGEWVAHAYGFEKCYVSKEQAMTAVEKHIKEQNHGK